MFPRSLAKQETYGEDALGRRLAKAIQALAVYQGREA